MAVISDVYFRFAGLSNVQILLDSYIERTREGMEKHFHFKDGYAGPSVVATIDMQAGKGRQERIVVKIAEEISFSPNAPQLAQLEIHPKEFFGEGLWRDYLRAISGDDISISNAISYNDRRTSLHEQMMGKLRSAFNEKGLVTHSDLDVNSAERNLISLFMEYREYAMNERLFSEKLDQKLGYR